MADYYDNLGLNKGASSDDIRRAYRKLAQEHHPDKTGGGDDKRFREINEAYQVLSDTEKRSQYDRFGRTFDAGGSGQSGADPFSDFSKGFGGFSWQENGGAGMDFGDIFSDIFGFGGNSRGGNSRGVDLEMNLEITFLEAVFGTEKEVSLQKKDVCPACEGSGARAGTKLKTCPTCHGQGQIRRVQKTILGSFATTATCTECSGRGKIPEQPCDTCGGVGIKQQIKTIKVIIPPGIDDSQRIRLSGQGESGYAGSRAGDLFVRVKVAPHPKLHREGFNIVSEAPISFYQAALGTRVEVETVDGSVELKIPAGTQSGRIFRLRLKGVPHISTKRRGDHLVTVRVVTPIKISKREKEILHKLAEEKGELVDVGETVWEKIKEQFE